VNNLDVFILHDPWFGPPAFWRATDLNCARIAWRAMKAEPSSIRGVTIPGFLLNYSGNPFRMSN